MPSPTTSNPGQPGAFDTSSEKPENGDAKLLERIRTRFTYMDKAWKINRDLGDLDMVALSPVGPIDPKEKELRDKAKRPNVHMDQLKQYPRTLVNQVRQNPQGVKVNPAGNGATDETATLRGDRIRAIEYESNASQAYLTALKCAAQRGCGVITLEVEEIAWDGWDQRIKIVREPDVTAVLWDPDCKEADSSDMQDGFKLWQMPIDEFKRAWPTAEVVDANLGDSAIIAPGWINVERQTVQVARYSYFEKIDRYVYLLSDGSPTGKKVFKDELPEGTKTAGKVMTFADGSTAPILKEKKAIEKRTKQCITNGVEILARADWVGRWIPIFPMLGEENYYEIDGHVERILESYIRGAIDGQRAFDSAKTNEVEAANMVPKIVYLGFEGQFNTATDWKNINKIPTVFAEVKKYDEQGQPYDLPQREQYDPPINSMEVMAEAARRAIQSAVGSHGFTIQDDTNVKSGRAVDSLKKQSDVGSFHFIDSYEVTIRHIGRAVDDLLDKIEDTPRDVATRSRDGITTMVRINEPVLDPKTGKTTERRYTPRDPKTQQPMVDAAHDVVIDVGPSYQTERAEASSLAQSLLGSPMGPMVADLAVRMSSTGPLIDQIAERLTPPQFQKKDGQADLPPEVKQRLGQLTQQNQEMTAELQRLLAERDSKAADNASREKIAASADAVKKLAILADVRSAQIQAASKGVVLHEELTSEENIAAAQMEADREIAALAHERAMEMQGAGAAQDADASAQEHAQGLDAAAAGHDQAMEQQDAGAEQAAAAAAAAAPAAEAEYCRVRRRRPR